MIKSTDQKIVEIEIQVEPLEKQKTFPESQVFIADNKTILLDLMNDFAKKKNTALISENVL